MSQISPTGSTAPVLTLPTWAQTIAGPAASASRSRSAAGHHPALVVGGDRDDRAGAQAQQPDRPVDRDVPLLPDQHPQPRRAGQPVRLDVPARPAQDLVPPGGQPGDVRLLRTGHETDRRGGRQPEQLRDPAASHLLGDRGGRTHRIEPGVLVPDRGQPVRGQRRRGGPADDEPEVPAAAGRHHARVDGRGQRRDHRRRIVRTIRQRSAQGGPQLGQVRARCDPAVGQAGEIGRGVPVRLAQRSGPVRFLHCGLLSPTVARVGRRRLVAVARRGPQCRSIVSVSRSGPAAPRPRRGCGSRR